MYLDLSAALDYASHFPRASEFDMGKCDYPVIIKALRRFPVHQNLKQIYFCTFVY
jgi:hypothetical protein